MADQLNLDVNNQVPSFIQKWRDLQPFAATLPKPATHAVFNMDLQRLKAGQQPLSQNETLLGLKAASDLQSHLPEATPHGWFDTIKNVPSAAVGDLKQVVQSIPKMPSLLVQEAKALPQAPAAIGQGLAHGSLEEVANAPGVRMLPGSFLAANLTHPQRILEHPVMSALDVAPYLGEGMKFIPEEYRAAIKGKLDTTLDKFQVGPVSVGTNRAVNVARRTAERSVDEIVTAANEFARNLPEADREALKKLITQEDPYVPPNLRPAFQKLKGHQEALNNLKQNTHGVAMSTVANAHGRDAVDLFKEHADEIMDVAEKTGAEPADVFNGIMRREGLQEFKPHEIISGLKKMEGEPLFVPDAVNKALTRLYNPHIATGFGKAYEKAINVFRTAVLPLSVKWHITNAAGMTAVVGAEVGPEALKYIGEASDMVKNHKLPVELGQPGIFGERGMKAATPDDFFNLSRGKEMHKLLNSSQFDDYAAKIGKPLGKVIDKSYRVANMVDHMGTAIGYLYGKDKAIGKGMSQVEAHAKGIEMARRVMYDWDAITPVERQIIKSIFPFYGWIKTITKITAKYPINHPVRAAIISNLGRAEMEDQNTGIPEEYRQLFTFGKPNDKGEQKGFDVKRFNPFSDVANIFTLGGLIGMTNPFISGITESLGIGRSGAGQAYPRTVYNPVTGRQEAAHKNVLQTITENFVPQSAALGRFIGVENEQSKRLKQTNPQAYKEQFWSSLGLPMPQTVSLGKIAAQSEVNRYQAVSAQINAIIKSGNFGKLRNYNNPALDTVAARLEQLSQSGQLDQYISSKNGVAELDPQEVLQLVGL